MAKNVASHSLGRPCASRCARLVAAVGVVFALALVPHAAEAQSISTYLEGLVIYHGTSATEANEVAFSPALSELMVADTAIGGFNIFATVPADATAITVTITTGGTCFTVYDEYASDELDGNFCNGETETFNFADIDSSAGGFISAGLETDDGTETFIYLHIAKTGMVPPRDPFDVTISQVANQAAFTVTWKLPSDSATVETWDFLADIDTGLGHLSVTAATVGDADASGVYSYTISAANAWERDDYYFTTYGYDVPDFALGENFFVLVSAGNAAGNSPSRATAMPNNILLAATPTLALSASAIDESGTTEVTVTLPLTVTPATAVTDTDISVSFGASDTSATTTLTAGTEAVSATITLGTLPDGIVDADPPLSIPLAIGATPPVIVLTVDKDAYVEGTDTAIVVTATATPPPTADLDVNVRVEGGGIARFLPGSGDPAHNKTISITGGETTGTVDYNIQMDDVDEEDTDDQVMASVRDPDTAGAYTYDNNNAPTFMVSNEDHQPGSPTLTSVTVGDGAITVVWSAPSEIGSRDLRNYSVCIADTARNVRTNMCASESKATFDFGFGTTDNEDQGTDTSDTSYQYTLTGLTNDTAYFVGVAARNGVSRVQGPVFTGVSVYALYQESGADATVTPTATATAPGAPESATAARGTETDTVDVTWVPARGGATPTGFQVCVSHFPSEGVSGCSGGRTATAAASATTLTVVRSDVPSGDIRDNIEQLVAVRAVAGTGAALQSAWTIATPNPLPERAVVTTVGDPVSPVATGGDQSITVTWTEPTTSATVLAPAGYRVLAGPATYADLAALVAGIGGIDADVYELEALAGTTTVTFTDGEQDDILNIDIALANDTEYRVAIRSATSSGFNDWIEVGTVTPAVAALPSLSIAATKAVFTEGSDLNLAVEVTSDVAAPTGGLPVRATLTGAESFIADIERLQLGTMLAGETTVTLTFAIADDADTEAAATATVTLADNAAYTISTATATATINDDDTVLSSDATLSSLEFFAGTDTSGTALTLSPAFSASLDQSGATLAFTTTPVPTTVTQATITFATTDPAADVQTEDGTVITSPHTFDLNVGDTTYLIDVFPVSGDMKTFTFQINRAATTPDPTPTPDLPTLTIAADSATVTEADGAMLAFTVTSDAAAPTGGLAVMVTLQGGDAFVAAAARTQSATIAEGETTATVNFPITNDGEDEDDAAVTATLGASAAYEGGGATATAMILDDDEEETPTAFSFTAQSDLEPGVEVTSNAVTVAGLSASDVAVAVVTTAGSVAIADASGTAVTTGLASNTDTVTATVTSGACGTSVTATVSIGGGSADFVVTTRACSTDASLSALAFSGVTLAPAFAAGTVDYTAEVASSVASTTVTATATDTRANVAGDGVVSLVGGTNNVVITVTAEDGSTRDYTVTIARDRLPTADAGADISLAPEQTVTLTGAGADPDGASSNAVTGYAWTLDPALGTLSDATSATPTYTAPTREDFADAGSPTVTLTLTVSFTNGESPSDALTITIRVTDPAATQAAGIVSVTALDRSVAQQSIGLIAQRFTPTLSTPSTPGTPSGGQSSQLVSKLKQALTGDARARAEQGVENISHTAPAPGSIQTRHSDDKSWRRLRGEDINLLDILERNPVAFGLGHGDGGAENLGFWLATSHSEVSGTPIATDGTSTDYDGHARTVQGGVDQSFNGGALLFGLALGWNASEIDFTQNMLDAAAPTRGEIERTGLTLNPYLSWRAGPNSSLWVLGGYGTGDYKVTLRGDNRASSATSDAKQWLLAGGLEGSLLEQEGFEVLGRVGGFVSRTDVDAATFNDGINTTLLGFDSSSWQLQGEVETARTLRADGLLACRGCSLRQYLLGTARVLGGDDAHTSGAFDLGIGIKGDLRAKSGLTFDVGARVQVSDGQDAKQSTVYGALRYDHGGDQRGFTAALTQGMSQALESNWRTGAFDGAGARTLATNPTTQLTFGYGWGASFAGRVGVLAAFGEMKALGAGMEQAVGVRFEAERFELRVETRERAVERKTELRVERKF